MLKKIFCAILHLTKKRYTESLHTHMRFVSNGANTTAGRKDLKRTGKSIIETQENNSGAAKRTKKAILNKVARPLSKETARISSTKAYETQNPLQTQETKSAYLKRAALLINAAADHANGSEVTIPDVIEWFVNKANSLAPNTVRQYRAALVTYINEQSRLGLISPDMTNQSIQLLQMIRSAGNYGSNTSSRKAKSVTQNQIARLTSKLESKKNLFANAASLMFKGSLVAGLRPQEWFTAALEIDKKSGNGILKVTNAKATNGRSFGKTRELFIPAQSVETVKSAIESLSKLKAAGFSQDRIYRRCKDAVRRAGVVNRDRNVCLYTARHQFTANMKNIYSPEEVALLLGHNTSETASRHYGKRRSGHPEYRDFARLVKPASRPTL